MKDLLWWAKFILKRLLILGFMVGAAWYAIQGSKQAPPANVPNVQPQTVDLNEKALQNMSPEQKAEMKEIGLEKGALTVEVVSPAFGITAGINRSLAPAMAAASRAHNAYLDFISNFTAHWAGIVEHLKTVFAVILIGMVGMRAFRSFEPLRIFSLFLLKLSNISLILISTAALVMTYGFNSNVWRDFNFVLFWIPVGLLFAGAVGSWTVDDNFPVWKTLYTTMAFPLISGLGIMIKGLFF